MSKIEEKLLTETELELMNILWELGEGTVREVMMKLSLERKLAYTSVSTIMRILEKKSVLKSRKSGKHHIYTPLINKAQYQSKGLEHLVDNVFSGAPIELVKTLIDSKQINSEDLELFQELISQRLNL